MLRSMATCQDARDERSRQEPPSPSDNDMSALVGYGFDEGDGQATTRLHIVRCDDDGATEAEEVQNMGDCRRRHQEGRCYIWIGGSRSADDHVNPRSTAGQTGAATVGGSSDTRGNEGCGVRL